jgi:hypothetical protein
MPTGIYIRTEKTRKILSDAKKNNPVRFWLGKNRSKETKRKISETKKGIKLSEEFKTRLSRIAKDKGFGKWMKGKKHTEETKKKMSISSSGEKNPSWIKDRTKLKKREERNDSAYQDWSRSVKKRDKWKCKINNKDCCGKLVAHHILSWSKFPKERYNIKNGITLCHYHHPHKRDDEERLMPFFKKMVVSGEQ